MGQKKLVRFAAIKTYEHVLENPENMPGQWAGFFGNDQPLVLELACGKGEYAVGLGQMYPGNNYLGVDVKGNRIYIGAKKALEQGLKNVGFLRTQIDRITTYFNPGEVSDIWLTFPDPQLRKGKYRKRLTHPAFLRKYQTFLKTDGHIHLKTDSTLLYNFTKRVIELYGCTILKDYDDVYAQATETELLNIKTHYEGLDIAQSGKIYFLKFRLPAVLDEAKDEILKQIVEENEIGRER
ncbi:tRNA (guanosine(46)-N7)-methyltransferase TrmB [Polluticaenibacter yanchengensis]|uniref:tRNA (guanine-N(7)-)-methyltransferase n=1 Tax=Polluticaenibacter yanchengensis TaxID=3014562 RepID=A0ABT4UEP6_9BACT|nr:tRNA (guanosine(46)-N7)-methyltransferase TrmB [Chitinophagaceae bacterium LY-5]